MYVCMYVCMYVYMYVYMYACMHACMHVPLAKKIKRSVQSLIHPLQLVIPLFLVNLVVDEINAAQHRRLHKEHPHNQIQRKEQPVPVAVAVGSQHDVRKILGGQENEHG
jgi:hypothetical protein